MVHKEREVLWIEEENVNAKQISFQNCITCSVKFFPYSSGLLSPLHFIYKLHILD